MTQSSVNPPIGAWSLFPLAVSQDVQHPSHYGEFILDWEHATVYIMDVPQKSNLQARYKLFMQNPGGVRAFRESAEPNERLTKKQITNLKIQAQHNKNVQRHLLEILCMLWNTEVELEVVREERSSFDERE
jgi:hypothetical protein